MRSALIPERLKHLLEPDKTGGMQIEIRGHWCISARSYLTRPRVGPCDCNFKALLK